MDSVLHDQFLPLFFSFSKAAEVQGTSRRTEFPTPKIPPRRATSSRRTTEGGRPTWATAPAPLPTRAAGRRAPSSSLAKWRATSSRSPPGGPTPPPSPTKVGVYIQRTVKVPNFPPRQNIPFFFFFQTSLLTSEHVLQKSKENESLRNGSDLRNSFYSFVRLNSPEGVTDLSRKYGKFPWGGKLGAFTVFFPFFSAFFFLSLR